MGEKLIQQGVPEGSSIALREKDLLNSPLIVCTKCKKSVVLPVFQIHCVSAILNPTGEEILYPRQIGWACLRCRKVVKPPYKTKEEVL